jgi:hypothetical protein
MASSVPTSTTVPVVNASEHKSQPQTDQLKAPMNPQPQVAPPVGIITEPATLPGNIVTRGPNGPVEAPSTIPAPEQGMGGTLQEKGTPAKSTNKEIQSYLDSLIGKEGGIQSFASEAELQVAIASGQVESGDLVAINGKIRTVE